DEFAPLRVVVRRVGPAEIVLVEIVARFPVRLVRIGMRGERLRHEPDFDVRLRAAFDVRFDDAVDNGPVIDGLAGGVFGVGVGGAPLEAGCPVAGSQHEMRADVTGERFRFRISRNIAEFVDEFASVGRVSVIGFVVAEEVRDWLVRADGGSGVDVNRHGFLRKSRGREKEAGGRESKDCIRHDWNCTVVAVRDFVAVLAVFAPCCRGSRTGASRAQTRGMNVSYWRQIPMPSPEKRTFSLPTEQAGYIDTLVASGAYASGSEVVRAGLRALQERDTAVEKWLREEVLGVYDAMQSDPRRAISGEKVFATIRARHADRLKKRRDLQG